MRLEEAEIMLAENDIPFDLVEYKDENEYLHHVMLFPESEDAGSCKVLAVVIRSNNGNKDVEIQFNEDDGVFYLHELYFGAFCFDMFEYQEEIWAEKLIADIKQIQKGDLAVIVANNIERNFGLWERCYDLNDADDENCGKRAFEEETLRIRTAEDDSKGVLGKLFDRMLRTKIQYEIYDWNTYQCVIKE